MPHLMPHLLYVSARAHGCSCLDQCRAAAGRRWRHRPGGPGALCAVDNRRAIPLYVPPGVTLAGAGQGVSIIDGEGATNLVLSSRASRAEPHLIRRWH